MISKPEQPADERLLNAHDLALSALREITPADTIGPAADAVVEDDGVVSLRFHTRLAGYPGWYWTVSVAVVDDAEPTVLEVELLPGDGALLAPDWVPWATRLAEYRAAQAAAAAAGEAADESDVDDESDLDDDADDDADLDDSDDDDSDDDSDDEDADLDDDDEDADEPKARFHAGDLDGVDIDEFDEDAETETPDSDDDLDDSDDDDSDEEDSDDDERERSY